MDRYTRTAVLAHLLACLVCSISFAQAGSAQTRRVIAGRVLDGEGSGAGGAEVILRWRVHPELPGLMGYSLGGRGVGESRHRADKEGRYRLEPYHPGPFLVVAIRGNESSVQTFPVMPGDYAELRLEPSHFVGGVVVDGDGEPVAGAEVRMLPDPRQWSRVGLYGIPERRGGTRTDEQGRFRMHFEHGYLRGPRLDPLVGLWVETRELTNLPHQLIRPNASSRELRVTLHAQVPARGTIHEDIGGRPVVGARVTDPIWPREARTAEDGSYRMPDPVGPEQFVFAPGFQPAMVPVPTVGRSRVSEAVVRGLRKGLKLRARLLDDEGDPLSGTRVLLSVPRGGEIPFEQTVKPGADGVVSIDWAPSSAVFFGFVELGGRFVQFHAGSIEEDTDLGDVRVSQRTLSGQLLSSQRAPIAHARVVLHPQGLDEVMPRVTYTDRGGRFWFAAVADVRQVVIGGAASHGMASRVVSTDDLDGPLQLVVPEGDQISGTVVDPRGDPVPGAWVMISRGGGLKLEELPAPTLSSTTLCTLTDQDGGFRFRGLDEGGRWSLMGQFLRDDTVCAGSLTAANGSVDLVVGMTTFVR